MSKHINPETNDTFKSFEEAIEFCGRNDAYLPVDRGQYVRPQFAIEEKPQVGDEVSKAFNGDAYPVGRIVRVSKTFKRIETSEGAVFFRRPNGGWRCGRTWWLVKGVVNERNPHF